MAGPASDAAGLRQFVRAHGVAVCGAFPGVIRTRMNGLLKAEDPMLREPSEGAAVLLHLGLEKPKWELSADNARGLRPPRERVSFAFIITGFPLCRVGFLRNNSIFFSM